MHESGNASQHAGHHQHQHNASPTADEDAGNQQKTFQFHADCVSCFSMLNLAMLAESKMIPALSMTHQIYSSLFKTPTPYLALPERPQWLIAV